MPGGQKRPEDFRDSAVSERLMKALGLHPATSSPNPCGAFPMQKWDRGAWVSSNVREDQFHPVTARKARGTREGLRDWWT